MRLKHVKGAREALEAHSHVATTKEEIIEQLSKYNKDNKPVRIEIGMGKGTFIIEMAQKYPEYHFIGIELFDSVLIHGVRRYDAMEQAPTNLTFARCDAIHLADVIQPHTLDTIYINFSDPWPKKRHTKRRLTAPQFLKMYEQLLIPNGHVIQKTDNVQLFEYSLMSFSQNDWTLEQLSLDLHHNALLNEENVRTEYEERFAKKGQSIYYLKSFKNKTSL